MGELFRGFGLNVGRLLKNPKHVLVDAGKGQPQREGIQLTEPSPGIPMIDSRGNWRVGADRLVVSEKQPSGFWALLGIHKSKVHEVKKHD